MGRWRQRILRCTHSDIGIFISPIQILVELTEMMQKGLSGFRRFLDVVETEPVDRECTGRRINR